MTLFRLCSLWVWRLQRLVVWIQKILRNVLQLLRRIQQMEGDNLRCFHFDSSRNVQYCDQLSVCLAVCLSVCLCVCLFISPFACLKNHVSKLHEMFCTCHLWSWLNSPLKTMQYVIICYVLSVLWMTSRFHTVGPMSHNQRRRVCFVEFTRWQHRGRSCCLGMQAC